MSIRKYGWKPDVPDQRDHHFMVTAPIALPAAVDLKKSCEPVYDQGQLGSCTGNAIAGALQYEEIMQNKPDKSIPSRLFIYWNERYLEGTVNSDSGAMIRDGLKSLNKWGFCSELLWPYSDDTTSIYPLFTTKPSAAAYAAAKKEIVTKYARVAQTATSIKTVLAQGHPVVFGFSVYESFETATVAHTGIVPMPGMYETLLGGHAVLLVGYNDATQMFTVKNSWGTGWGDKGYFYMPYQYVTSPNLADDFWVITAIP